MLINSYLLQIAFLLKKNSTSIKRQISFWFEWKWRIDFIQYRFFFHVPQNNSMCVFIVKYKYLGAFDMWCFLRTYFSLDREFTNSAMFYMWNCTLLHLAGDVRIFRQLNKSYMHSLSWNGKIRNSQWTAITVWGDQTKARYNGHFELNILEK